MNKKMTDIFALFESNEDAVKDLQGAKTADEVSDILKRYGLEVSSEEFLGLAKELTSDEMSEDMLDLVAGGGFWKSAYKAVRDFCAGFLAAM